MPVHLGARSRREFLIAGLAGSIGITAFAAEEAGNPHRWAFLADTHIAADRKAILRETCMGDNLEKVVAEIVGQKEQVAGAIVHGDCALLNGQSGDYTTLGGLLDPFSNAKIPTHLTLGNHDDRVHFMLGMANRTPKERPVPSKHVSIVKSERANFFLLDTLEFVNKTPGNLGEEQLDWIAKALDAHSDKPAIICLHHNPVFAPVLEIAGLKDTPALWKILAPRKHVKAIFFGHTHHWSKLTQDGIHCVNLPPTAYVFQGTDPNGWVEVVLGTDGAQLTFHALDKSHRNHNQKVDMAWRT